MVQRMGKHWSCQYPKTGYIKKRGKENVMGEILPYTNQVIFMLPMIYATVNFLTFIMVCSSGLDRIIFIRIEREKYYLHCLKSCYKYLGYS